MSKKLFIEKGIGRGRANWRFIHDLLIQNGYGAIRRENDHTAGNRDAVVFDVTKVKPIAIVS